MEKLVLLIFLFSVSTKVYSFPQNISYGYTSCVTCHISPDGGGKASDYGHLALKSFIPDKKDLISWLSNYREERAKNLVAGYDENYKPKAQFGLGGSIRGMLLSKHQLSPENSSSIRAFPMLIEARTIALYGNFGFYAALNLLLERDQSKPESNNRIPKAFSRAHWLLYKLEDKFYFRLGRMELPFGLKTVDHTRATRSLIGFGTKDQHYGLQFDYVTEKFSMHFMPFFGNYLKEKYAKNLTEEKGVSLNLNFIWPRHYIFGASTLFKRTSLGNKQLDYSLSFQGKLPKKSYILGEFVHSINSSEEEIQKFATFFRIGKHFSEWVDLYLECSESHSQNLKPYMNNIRLGAKGRLFPWLELEPFIQYKYQSDKFIPKSRNIWLALQLHAFY